MSDVQIVGPGGVKATLHDDGSITYPAGAGPAGRRAESGAPPLPKSMTAGDEELGIGSQPLVSATLGGKTLPVDVADRKRERSDAENPIANDPIAQQAILTPLTAGAGAVVAPVLGRVGRFVAKAGEEVFGAPKPLVETAKEALHAPLSTAAKAVGARGSALLAKIAGKEASSFPPELMRAWDQAAATPGTAAATAAVRTAVKYGIPAQQALRAAKSIVDPDATADGSIETGSLTSEAQ